MPTLVGKRPLESTRTFMPTGTPIADLARQLHAAAERVLLRDGAAALTSRAVTTEARLAKGILHRHFTDFDTFLATLVLARVERIEDLASQLRASAGTATVAANVSRALASMLDPPTVALVVLVWPKTSRRRNDRIAGQNAMKGPPEQ